MTEHDPVVIETTAAETAGQQSGAAIPPGRPRKAYAGMWGVPEVSAVAAGALALAAALTAYFFFVIPSNRELARNRSEADRLEAEVASEQAKYGDITTSEAQVEKIVTSMDDFETRFLPAAANGQTALYQRLNGLFAAYSLVNTSGPDYAPLETVDQGNGQQSEEERGRAKFRSIYPGVYVTMTVEGTYHNLRRFIREIETANEFVVISSVELSPSDTQVEKKETADPNAATTGSNPTAPSNPMMGGRPGAPGGFGGQIQQVRRPQGKMHGEIVSLRIEMAAYFRRPNFAPLTIPPGQ